MTFKERDPRKHAVVYDLESYPNLFFVACRKYSRPAPDKPYVEGETNIFFIDDYKDFKTYMTVNKNALWVAFNNKLYDGNQ